MGLAPTRHSPRPGFDLPYGQGGGARPRLHGQEGLTDWPWHRRRADGPACARAGPTPLGVPPTSCVRRWGCAHRRGLWCTVGPTAASTPTPSSPPAAGWMSHCSPSARVLACAVEAIPDRTGRPSPTGWRARRCGRNRTPFQSARRRAGASRQAHARPAPKGSPRRGLKTGGRPLGATTEIENAMTSAWLNQLRRQVVARYRPGTGRRASVSRSDHPDDAASFPWSPARRGLKHRPSVLTADPHPGASSPQHLLLRLIPHLARNNHCRPAADRRQRHPNSSPGMRLCSHPLPGSLPQSVSIWIPRGCGPMGWGV